MMCSASLRLRVSAFIFIQWMTSQRGGTLSYLPESLSPIWLQKIKKAKIFIENVLDESLMRARLASVKPKRTGKTAEYIREMQHFNFFIDALLKRNRSHQELQKIFAPTKLSSKDLDQLSAIRNDFSKKMKAWSDANKISYIPSYSPLPSVCIQEEARIQYASSHFTEEGRLNQKGVKKIIEKVGVAEL